MPELANQVEKPIESLPATGIANGPASTEAASSQKPSTKSLKFLEIYIGVIQSERIICRRILKQNSERELRELSTQNFLV
jgi:hypothetical protein